MTTTVSRARKSTSSLRSGFLIVAALALAAALVTAVVVIGGGDDTPAPQSEAARIPAGSLRQVSSAAIEGEPLPRFDPGLGSDPAAGTRAPTIVASYFDNVEVRIDPADGQPRVILFVAHWCPHCQAEVATLQDWFEANGKPDGVEVMAISTSVDEGAPNYPPSDWLLREAWPVPVLRDSAAGDLAAGYGLSAFPFLVALDANGTVVSRSTGGQTIAQWEATLVSAMDAAAT